MEARQGKPRRSLESLFQFFKLLLIGIVVMYALLGFNQIPLSHFFPIKTVRIYGVNRVSQEEVRTLLLPLVNQGFFAINIEYIRDSLLQIPWLAELYVRRVWPDQVEIRMVEREPIAEWNGESLLSDTGELFSPRSDTYPAHLPKFTGMNGQQVFMLQNYKDINRLLSPLHAKISYLELTPDWTWKLILDNGMTMQIGRRDSLVRLNHFMKVYPKIIGTHADNVDSIDLRYPNGVAVHWKNTVSSKQNKLGKEICQISP